MSSDDSSAYAKARAAQAMLARHAGDHDERSDDRPMIPRGLSQLVAGSGCAAMIVTVTDSMSGNITLDP